MAEIVGDFAGDGLFRDRHDFILSFLVAIMGIPLGKDFLQRLGKNDVCLVVFAGVKHHPNFIKAVCLSLQELKNGIERNRRGQTDGVDKCPG
jgi:hypothetical protein